MKSKKKLNPDYKHAYSSRQVWKEILQRCNGKYSSETGAQPRHQHMYSIQIWLQESSTVHITPGRPRLVYGF